MKHEIPPVYDGNSRILILGSFPSEASRSAGFYYGHPRNRFWRVISAVLGAKTPADTDAKIGMLLKNGIALWDVVGSCTVTGSADSSIKDVVPNDLSVVFRAADIRAVYLNGSLAYSLYKKYGTSDAPYFRMPSTSPANASYSYEALLEAWSVIRCMLETRRCP